MNKSPDRLNLFFRLVIVASMVFVFTILAMIATAFSVSQSPVVSFLNQYGGQLLVGEVIVTILVSFLALFIDRIQSLRDPQNKIPAIEKKLDSQESLESTK